MEDDGAFNKAVIFDKLDLVKDNRDAIPLCSHWRPETRVVFCITCLKRDEQLMTALAINIVLWWQYRQYWRMAICTFGEDDNLVSRLEQVFKKAFDAGLLVLASGGSTGKKRAADGAYSKPKWMPLKPHEALPRGGGASSEVVGMPYLQYWHASTAKNASHQVANHAFGSNCLWVNWDCDQIAPVEYVKAVLNNYERFGHISGLCMRCMKCSGALTGRLAYRGEDFMKIGGYDEYQTPPSGGQDVDLRIRLGMMQSHPSGAKTRSEGDIRLTGQTLCGTDLPNDFERQDRGWLRGGSKVQNCDERVIASFTQKGSNKTWGSMNESGWARIYKPRLDNREISRNTIMLEDQVSIGCWFVVIKMVPILKDKEHLKPCLPPLSTHVPAWTSDDEDEWEEAETSSHNKAMVLATPIGTANQTCIDIVVLGARQLYYLERTDVTCLGPHAALYHVRPRQCSSIYVHDGFHVVPCQ